MFEFLRVSSGYAVCSREYVKNFRRILESRRFLRNQSIANWFVFGNGPSMKIIDSQKLARFKKSGYKIIAANSYLLSDLGKCCLPDIYVFSDPIYLPNSGVKSDVVSADKVDEVWSTLRAEKIPTFVPTSWSDACSPIVDTRMKLYFFIDIVGFRSLKMINPFYPFSYTSLSGYKALALSQYLNANKVYICGIDNDRFLRFKVDENNRLSVGVAHFYDGLRVSSQRTMGDALRNSADHFYSLESCFKGRNIINLHKDSFVDSFDKKHDLDIYVS